MGSDAPIRPIDPTRFGEAVPASVRAKLRSGAEPYARWVRVTGGASQVMTCIELAYGKPIELVPEELGWLCGMTMFVPSGANIASALIGCRRLAAVPHVLAAFAAGVAVNLPTTHPQWTAIGELVARARAANVGLDLDALVPAIASGCGANAATIRGVALELARLVGDRGALRAALERAGGARMDDAIAVLGLAVDRTSDGEDRDEDLLARLLDAWRASDDERLGDPIAVLGARLAVRRGPIAPAARPARDHQERAWFELVQSAGPADVDRLLDAPWPTSIDDATVRVHALADLPVDPRIARAVVAVAARFRLPRARAFHDAIATLLARYPRATALAAIEAIERGDPERGEYGRARFELERGPPSSGEAAPALVEAARARTSDAVDVAALWAAHAASPGDLHVRAVLGDALQRAGDPRGELIACQLADTPAARRRAKALLAAHGPRWAPLPRLAPDATRFAGGFLVAAHCRASAPELLESLADPAWCTVEDLRIDAEVDARALASRLPLLRRLAAASATSIARLARADVPALEALACNASWEPRFPVAVIGGRWWRDLAVARALTERLPASAAIVHLALPWTQVGVLVASRHAARCEVRASMGEYRGFTATDWTIRLRAGRVVADVAWNGGDPAAQVRGASIVEDLARAGIATIHLRAPKRPTPQLATWIAEVVARDVAGARVLLDGEPIDLGASAAP